MLELFFRTIVLHGSYEFWQIKGLVHFYYIYIYIYIHVIAIKMKVIIIPNSSSRAHLKKGLKPIFNSKRLNSRPDFVKYA